MKSPIKYYGGKSYMTEIIKKYFQILKQTIKQKKLLIALIKDQLFGQSIA